MAEGIGGSDLSRLDAESQLAVRSQLAAILASREFRRSPRRRAFLQFIVDETLAGRAGELKETLIGVHVFGRAADYDPKSDPVVRAEAGKLRAALAAYYSGEGRACAVVIEVPRGGYAPAWRIEVRTPSRALRPRRIALALLAPVAAAILLLIGSALPQLRRLGPREVAEVTPLTSYPGLVEAPSFSPDGNQVAFSWNGEKGDNFDIYLKVAGSSSCRRLTDNPDPEGSPAFSPDGTSIAFVRLSNERGQIYLIPSIGGSERLLGEFPFPIKWPFNSPLLAWFPDGKSLAVRGLAILSVEAGEMRRLTSGGVGSPVDFSPAVSPDGRAIAFSRSVGYGAFEIFRADLDSERKSLRAPRQLTWLGGTNHTPVWTHDGHTVLFVHAGRSRMSLWKVAASYAGQPQELAFSAGPPTGLGTWWPALSRGGDRLAFVRDIHDVNIWRVSPAGSGQASAVRLIASSLDDYGGDYSPDGRMIAFASNRSGTPSIWTSDAGGSNVLQLYSQPGGTAGSPMWSPDGKRIAFSADDDRPRADGMAVYLISAAGGKPLRVSNGSGMAWSWSKDGKWIYFSSYRNGQGEIWKAPAEGGADAQVTHTGGFAGFESADGKSLYFSKPGLGVFQVPIEGGEERQILLPVVGDRNFRPVEDGIYFIPLRDADGKFRIKFLSFGTGGITTIAVLPGWATLGFGVAPDRRSFIYSQIDAFGSDLMMVHRPRGDW
jgi:Tol biopolymer transport system component